MAGCRRRDRGSRHRAAVFEVVYVEHEVEVFRYLARRLDAVTAEEAAVEVFATAWGEYAEDPKRDERDARRWLLGLAVAAVRRRRCAELQHLRHLASSGLSSESRHGHVARALVDLDPVDRDLLSLHVWAGVSHGCAGELVGVHPASARQRIDDAYAFVRRRAEAA
jgi:DNA-directed RNA polymerase specialized sigma24 family protein